MFNTPTLIKKFSYFLFSIFSINTLTCCKHVKVPSDIGTFILDCSIDKCMSDTKYVFMENTNTVYEDNVEVGKKYYQIVSNRGEWESYSYKKEEKYFGNQIKTTKLEDSSTMYLISSIIEIVPSTYKNVYSYHSEKHGKEDESLTKDKEEVIDEDYIQADINAIDQQMFFTQNDSNTKQGGLYYGDFFKTIIDQFQYMKVEDDILTYTLVDQNYTVNKESAIVSQTLKIDKLGRLLSIEGTAKNTSTNISSTSNVTCSYIKE